MRLDEQEIPSVSDKSPITEKQHKINRKKGVEGLLNDIPETRNYQPVSVNQRKAKSLALSKATPSHLFSLFITPRHCRLIAKHTNQKAQDLKGGGQTHKAVARYNCFGNRGFSWGPFIYGARSSQLCGRLLESTI